jgi:PAS domain S-box-containing protein
LQRFSSPGKVFVLSHTTLAPGFNPLDGLVHEFARFLDATSDAVVFLDRSYNFVFLNRRAQQILTPYAPAIGANIFETFPSTAEENSRENYRRSMELGEAAEFDAFCPDILQSWLRIQSYPSDNGIMIFFRDITQDKLAGEELRRKTLQTERQLAEIETIYRTAPIGLALFDLDDYHYLRLNDRQAAFFGLRPEQIVGRTLTEMAPIEGLRELFDQVASGEPVINYPLEGTLITDPDNYRYWTVSYFPVYAPDGSIQAITAASLEITQQKKAEQALIQSEKLAVVGRLASSIAHEINNPLEAVTNLLYLARHSDTLDEACERLDAAEIQLRRVAAITNQTLRFHKQATSPRAIAPEDLLRSVLSVFQGRIANSKVTVCESMRPSQPVHCFEGEIRQVLSNLISNALDAMSLDGGRLVVRTRLTTNWANGEAGVAITISDTGCGMTRETLAKLFDPFFTTKGLTGTGLGLWVTREIVDRHRGTLRVRSSQSPHSHGTTFTLFLPFNAVTR